MDLPKKNNAPKVETIEALKAEAQSRRLTVIVSGSNPEDIAFANQVAAELPGTIIDEYRGFLREKGKIFVVPSLTSMLEQDACLIAKIDKVDGEPAILISKNRTGRLGSITTPKIPSP